MTSSGPTDERYVTNEGVPLITFWLSMTVLRQRAAPAGVACFDVDEPLRSAQGLSCGP